MTSSTPHKMEDSLLHKLLVGSQRLQEVSRAAVLSMMIANALLVAWVWLHISLAVGIVAGVVLLAACSLNWALLWMLPRTGRSFGPDKPSALALTLLLTVIFLLIGFFAGTPSALWIALLAAFTITLLAYDATWIEPFRLQVTVQKLVTDKLSREGSDRVSVRVLHISDLHLERETSRERRLNALIELLQPDVIVFSGDFVNLSYTWDEQAKTDIRRVIGAWHAPLGVYCVSGTAAVEPLERVMEFVQGLDNLTLLPNRWVSLAIPGGQLHIFGHITTHDLLTDRRTLADGAASMPQNGVRLMLSHAPDVAPEAAAAGFDLYLCGHTHGGQIRLPFIGAVLSSSQLGRRFVMGRYQLGAMTLYTTRGVGMEGWGAPRARFLCPPEIVLWELSSR